MYTLIIFSVDACLSAAVALYPPHLVHDKLKTYQRHPVDWPYIIHIHSATALCGLWSQQATGSVHQPRDEEKQMADGATP